MSKNSKYYLMIMNHKYYDLEKSKEDGYYYWPIERKKALELMKNNLTVYIYDSPLKRIIYKCERIEKKLIEDDDNKSISNRESDFVIKESLNKSIEDKVFIHLGNFVDPKDNQLLDFDSLRKNGLKTNRKGQGISEKSNLVKYLEFAFNSNGVNNISSNSKPMDQIEIEETLAKLANIIVKIKNSNEKEYFKTMSAQLSDILRSDYRVKLFERNKRYNDIGHPKFDEFPEYFEAAHIVDVKYINKFLEKNTKNFINSINLEKIKPELNLMLSINNGIFIPFKYHYYFDKDIIFLNSNLEFEVNNKFEKIIKIFNEEFFDLNRDLLENKEIIRLVKLRNKYRKIKN